MKLRKLLGALCAAAIFVAALPAAFAAGVPAFPDAGDIRHGEAVEAVVGLGLLSPKGDGDFDPQGGVTRGEAARMVALMLNGGRDLSWKPAGEPGFSDVRGHWAETYIGFCAEKGAAFAREDGKFDPNGAVTRFELLRMAEIALGRAPEEFSRAANWIAVAHAVGQDRGLLTGFSDLTGEGKAIVDRALTREEAAQILYNALNATPQTLKGGAYEDVKRSDGTASTLLYECYGFSSWEEAAASAHRPEPTPADPAKFTDAASIQHWEAVAALCKLGVVNGRDDGAFHPADTVTRAEAAKLLAVTLHGGQAVPDDLAVETVFSDTRGHWAEKDIGLCGDLAIIGGRGDGSFDPDGAVTGMEFVKMALAMLGYDPAAYGLVGARWAEKADELARSTSPSLYEGLTGVSLSRPLSRDDTAQVLYNALRCTPLCVKPAEGKDGVDWQFAPWEKEDGSPATLLWMHFGLDEVGEIPAQPKG